MAKTILKNVKGKEIPPAWRKKRRLNPNQDYEVTFRPMHEAVKGEDMPPEENFRPEFLEKLKKSDEDVKAGRALHYLGKEERNKLLHQLEQFEGEEDSEQWIADIKASRTRSELKTPLI